MDTKPARIQSLQDRIALKILNSPQQMISFQNYMGCCLYDPDEGYYATDRQKIGRTGDFYTSSSVGSIMGEVLAGYIVRLTTEDSRFAGRKLLVEWGGGTGRLARQILDELKREYPLYYESICYISIEQNNYHRKLQEESLREHASQVVFMTEQEWFAESVREGVVVFSNELLDAFPVRRVVCRNGLLYEIGVAWDSTSGSFYEKEFKAETSLEHYFSKQNIKLVNQQKAEVNNAAEQWMLKIAEHIKCGYVITIDYGDAAEEIYASHRMNGTLLCYRRHEANDNPYKHVGEQDITSHVNFTALISAGERAGLKTYSYTTQKQFLVEAGILEKLQTHFATDPFDPVARKNRAIRQILLSDSMSELFKVLVQSKKE